MNKITLSCENQDLENFTVLKRGQRVEPIDGIIYYTITRYKDNVDKGMVHGAIREALDTWQEALQPIVFVKTSDYDKAHIKIAFVPRDHRNTMLVTGSGDSVKCGCPYDFDGKEGVLAHAFPKVGRSILAGHLHLDEEENWSDVHGGLDKDLLTVLIHEIGHILNIGHSTYKKAIMHASYTGTKTKLHGDDLDAINAIYGDKIRDLVDDIMHGGKAGSGTDEGDGVNGGCRDKATAILLCILLIIYTLV